MSRKKVRLLVLVVLAIGIKVFSFFPSAVEHYYSNGIYIYISGAQRLLFGWIPFSIGDLFYAWAGIWLIVQGARIIKSIKNRQAGKQYFAMVGANFLTGILAVYVSFNILWGLNYNREAFGKQLGLTGQSYTDEDLVTVTKMLAGRINSLQAASENSRQRLATKRILFREAARSYARTEGKGRLQYTLPSVKPSIYSYLGNYLGFTGYYNPFSGEAQVNTTVPLFVRPFTTCHEIGHQLGYAKESEANFAGYLSASASSDTSFLYSVYFDMYLYSSRYLYFSDSLALKEIRKQLSPGVIKDREELTLFLIRYSTPVEGVIDRLYSKYLMANEQPAGKLSYNEVVGMLIAYYKKYGKV